MHKITSQDIQEVHSRKKKKSLKSSLPTFHPALSQPEDSKESWHFFSKYSLGSLTTHSILPRPPKLQHCSVSRFSRDPLVKNPKWFWTHRIIRKIITSHPLNLEHKIVFRFKNNYPRQKTSHSQNPGRFADEGTAKSCSYYSHGLEPRALQGWHKGRYLEKNLSSSFPRRPVILGPPPRIHDLWTCLCVGRNLNKRQVLTISRPQLSS